MWLAKRYVQRKRLARAAAEGDSLAVQHVLISNASWYASLVNEIVPFHIPDGTPTALFLAARYNHVEVMETLLFYGADVEKGCILPGTTPLHIALRYGHRLAIVILLAWGANPSSRDHQDFTPLMYAVRRKRLNRQDFTPLMYALAKKKRLNRTSARVFVEGCKDRDVLNAIHVDMLGKQRTAMDYLEEDNGTWSRRLLTYLRLKGGLFVRELSQKKRPKNAGKVGINRH